MSKGHARRPGTGYAEGHDRLWPAPIPGVTPTVCQVCGDEPCSCERTEDGPGQDGDNTKGTL